MQIAKPRTSRKPPWLKRRIPAGPVFEQTRGLVTANRLHTVCQEAGCPNIWECFSRHTATFMILGSVCTRNCGFCKVTPGTPSKPDPNEPQRIASAVSAMGLKYITLTSVTRDDLKDGGAIWFAKTIDRIRRKCPGTRIEVLIPDFLGSSKALDTVLTVRPDVLNHNIETVSRLYPRIRPQADYRRSLELLHRAAASGMDLPVKSGLMLGLGETEEEIRQTLADLIDAGCRMLTMGQYLQPSRAHVPVETYVRPERFEALGQAALSMGFEKVASAPLVRSSYHAQELFGEGSKT